MGRAGAQRQHGPAWRGCSRKPNGHRGSIRFGGAGHRQQSLRRKYHFQIGLPAGQCTLKLPVETDPSCRLAIFRTGLNAPRERSWESGSLSRPSAPFSRRYGMARWLCPGCAKGGDYQGRRYARGQWHDSSRLAWMYRTHDHTMLSRQRPCRLLPKLQRDTSFPGTSANGPAARWGHTSRDRHPGSDAPWPMAAGPMRGVHYAWSIAGRDGFAARSCA